jgi:hypothetical protein
LIGCQRDFEENNGFIEENTLIHRKADINRTFQLMNKNKK